MIYKQAIFKCCCARKSSMHLNSSLEVYSSLLLWRKIKPDNLLFPDIPKELPNKYTFLIKSSGCFLRSFFSVTVLRTASHRGYGCTWPTFYQFVLILTLQDVKFTSWDIQHYYYSSIAAFRPKWESLHWTCRNISFITNASRERKESCKIWASTAILLTVMWNKNVPEHGNYCWSVRFCKAYSGHTNATAPPWSWTHHGSQRLLETSNHLEIPSRGTL